jgi:hypothetical protein
MRLAELLLFYLGSGNFGSPILLWLLDIDSKSSSVYLSELSLKSFGFGYLFFYYTIMWPLLFSFFYYGAELTPTFLAAYFFKYSSIAFAEKISSFSPSSFD